jgi:hypothetical protein
VLGVPDVLAVSSVCTAKTKPCKTLRVIAAVVIREPTKIRVGRQAVVFVRQEDSVKAVLRVSVALEVVSEAHGVLRAAAIVRCVVLESSETAT